MSDKNKKIIKEDSSLFSSARVTIKAVVIEKDGKILILKRSKNSERYPDNYDLPGGHLDKGESIEDCLKREVKEETGLDVTIGDVISAGEYSDTRKIFDRVVTLRFIAYVDSGEVKLSEEHDSFEWLTLEDAEKRLKNEGYEREKREVIINAQKYLEMKNSLDGWKRCLAEFDNYKKRQAESNRDTVRYATENIVLQIIPVLDNFSSSVDHIPEDQKDGAWVQGIMYIKKQLEDVLKENGINEIDVKPGDDFDATICEAIADKECKSCKSKDYKFKNKIKKVIARGYKIGPARNASHSDAGGGKVIRPARVIVE